MQTEILGDFNSRYMLIRYFETCYEKCGWNIVGEFRKWNWKRFRFCFGLKLERPCPKTFEEVIDNKSEQNHNKYTWEMNDIYGNIYRMVFYAATDFDNRTEFFKWSRKYIGVNKK